MQHPARFEVGMLLLYNMEVGFYHGYHETIPPQVEQQGTQLETFQQRNLLLQEENSGLKERIHNLERYRHSRKHLVEKEIYTLLG